MNTSLANAAPRPEVLAPAGDWAALRAAVAHGADAVYFGLPRFNARHRATNFTMDELPEVMRHLHDHGTRGFVALNTLVFADELDDLVEVLTQVAAAGVDAVIVQDLGVARLIRTTVPGLPVHASTQMTLSEPRAIAWAGRELGLARVVLPRELSVAEIARVTAESALPVEVFVHGALCVAYSGQCLTSEALGGRSANRGQCAQACRLPYGLEVDGVPRDLGDRAYLLSPQDLAAHAHIHELVAAGVSSFKIEGRLKSPEYVAATSQVYRQAVDSALGGRAFVASRQQERDLALAYSRGFTPGFLDGVHHQRLVAGRFPKARGIKLGVTRGVTSRGVVVELEVERGAVKAGDGVVFDGGRPDEKEAGGSVWQVNADPRQPRRVELRFAQDQIDLAALTTGMIVWKTSDPDLTRRYQTGLRIDERHHRRPVSMRLSGDVGGPLTLSIAGAEPIEEVWPGPIPQASGRATTADEARACLARLGDTPLELAGFSHEVGQGVLLPKSVLNDLRRRAVARLLAKLEGAEPHAVADWNALADWRADIQTRRTRPETDSPRLTLLARNFEQLDAALAWRGTGGERLAAVYADFEDIRQYAEVVTRACAAGTPVGLATLRVTKPGEEGLHKPLLLARPDRFLIRNLGGLEYFREFAPGVERVADFALNIANDLTADLLHSSGFSTLVPSFDLNWEQFVALVRRADANWFEPVVHQHMPMFHMEHCLFAALLSNGQDFRTCGRPCDRHKLDLRDRVGSAFPVAPDAGCRNTVYNALPQSAAQYLGRMRALGLSRFRLDLLREDARQVGQLLDTYSAVLHGRENGRETWRQLQALDQLGVTRGTLSLA